MTDKSQFEIGEPLSGKGSPNRSLSWNYQDTKFRSAIRNHQDLKMYLTHSQYPTMSQPRMEGISYTRRQAS